MRVLVLGGGGREHALCWALERSASVDAVLCTPGNAGISEVAELRAVDPTDADAVVALARDERCNLVVVGPEAPLVAGVADALGAAGVPVFGPTAAAARIEGSKSFAKDVMAAACVPTGAYWSGTDAAAARRALDRFTAPYVVKADGLAAGKGVRICADRAEAEAAVDAALVDGAFGEAGARLVIEEFLHGPEISVFAVCGQGSAHPLAEAQDFKRALDGDEGLNTGGMGAYSPVPAWSQELLAEVGEDVFGATLAELDRRGCPYTGVLYAGLVLTAEGPKVLEFNARFGDPETQVLLPRFEGDLGLLLAACAGAVDSPGRWAWSPRACVTVVLAAGGYPGTYETGKPITGLEEAAALPDTLVFHAGTRRDGDDVVTAGGRVLAVSGLGDTIDRARAAAYAGADAIGFDGLHRRNDIAANPTR
ncbi:MAG TPA: phosphoribosylamine--glycine ligase [Egibacteraceae bacterium]|nr:phosphoribosylamine--glycine ligase [Egibacteraceae bacterium]